MDGCIKTVTEEELNELLAAFGSNDQLHGAGYLGGSRFKSFLERVSGKGFERQGRKFALKEELSDEIPF